MMTLWRGVRDLNPRGPMDHRLSRPAPYQARRTPHRIFCSESNLKKVSVKTLSFISAEQITNQRLHAELPQSNLDKGPEN